MRFFLAFLYLFISFSCASQKKEIIAKSTIKLEGKNTRIRDLIEIDGYYYMPEYPYSNCRMFFEDGTWVSFGLKRDIPQDEIKENMATSVVTWVKDKQLRWGNFWGVYKIENDTLIVNTYTKGSFLQGWSLYEEKYIIINKERINRISFQGLLKSATPYEYNHYINDKFYYLPADSLPSSDCWLKEEKWIWRHESDWKAYMEKVKKKKEAFKKK